MTLDDFFDLIQRFEGKPLLDGGNFAGINPDFLEECTIPITVNLGRNGIFRYDIYFHCQFADFKMIFQMASQESFREGKFSWENFLKLNQVTLSYERG